MKCGRLPAADVAYDAFVGFAFAQATNSPHVFAPLCGPGGERELERRAESDRREVLHRDRS